MQISSTAVIETLPKQKKEKLEYLDSIRGIVAIAIVLHHYFLGFDSNLDQTGRDWMINSPLVYYLVNGQLHISTFFVLSGRVIANSYYNILNCRYISSRNTKTLVSAIVRRPLRLFLPIFVCILFSAAFSKSGIYNYLNYYNYTSIVKVKMRTNWPDEFRLAMH